MAVERWLKYMIQVGYHGKAIIHFDRGHPVRVEENRFRDWPEIGTDPGGRERNSTHGCP